jgi:tetratricopeptide (TPR) repeat protein
MIVRTCQLILFIVTCSAMNFAIASKPNDITKAEMALIPEYCPDTMGFGYGDAYYNTSPRAPKWVAMMGKDFWSLHHYCWGLISYNRSMRHGTPRMQRNALIESALGDYGYVLNYVAPDFILLPEILTRVGEAELKLGHPDRANTAYARARQLKPDYFPAYARWIDYLIAKGQRAQAKELAREGLEYSPNAKVLQQQYRLLGGDPAQITPRQLEKMPVPEAGISQPDDTNH